MIFPRPPSSLTWRGRRRLQLRLGAVFAATTIYIKVTHMDSGGRIYVDPSEVLVKALGLKPVKRAVTPAEKKAGKIGRNAPCGCGSEIKFKKCCYLKQFDFDVRRKLDEVSA